MRIVELAEKLGIEEESDEFLEMRRKEAQV